MAEIYSDWNDWQASKYEMALTQFRAPWGRWEPTVEFRAIVPTVEQNKLWAPANSDLS